MKRRHGIIVFLLLVGAWLAAEWLLYRRTVPPADVADVDAFLRWRPDAERFVVLTNAGPEHLMATGRGGGLLPSGPSAYVSDPAGRLLDWSADVGDDPRFGGRWRAQGSSGGGRSLTRSEVSGWVTPATRPAG